MSEIDDMPADEFYQWMLYEQIEPFGERRADRQAGLIASIIANVNRGPRQQAYSTSDFVPNWEPQPTAPLDPKRVMDAMLLFQKVQAVRVGNV